MGQYKLRFGTKARSSRGKETAMTNHDSKTIKGNGGTATLTQQYKFGVWRLSIVAANGAVYKLQGPKGLLNWVAESMIEDCVPNAYLKHKTSTDCPDCDGKGAFSNFEPWGQEVENCLRCGGTGRINTEHLS